MNFALIAASICCARGAAAETFLALYSQPGDPIGEGVVRVFTEGDAAVTVTHESGRLRVETEPVDGERWTVELQAPDGASLLPGSYESASEYESGAPGRSGLAVSRTGRQCRRVAGRFVVLQAEYAPGGAIAKFAANFEQHCEGRRAALYGTVSIQSTLPIPAGPSPTPTPDPFLTLVRLESDPGDFVGGGVMRELKPAEGRFDAIHSHGFVRISFDGGSGNGWSFDFAAPADAELTTGFYDNARRWGSQTPIQPGLDAGGGSRGCNFLTGRFTILEAEYGPDDEVLRFAAEFEQHCEGLEPALRGTIRFRSSLGPDVPTPVPPTRTPTPTFFTTQILLDSEPGDYVGGGRQHRLIPSEGYFTARYTDGHLEIDFDSDADWHLDFAAPRGAELVAGTYNAAERYPFQSPARPGLSVSGGGRGCNTSIGSFVVFEAAFGADGSIERFAANFEQHCEGAAEALVGVVRFNSTVPVMQPTPTPRPPTPTPALRTSLLVVYSQEGDYIGRGTTAILTEGEGVFNVTHDPGHVGVEFEAGSENSWFLQFAAPGDGDLWAGTYENALNPFQSPNRPGLYVSVVGRGCGRVTGRFVIREAAYGSNGVVHRFAADFEQHCEGNPPALFGAIRFNSIIPTPAPPAATPTPDPSRVYLDLRPGGRLTAADGSFRASHTFGETHVGFDSELRGRWFLNFAAPECLDLVPGVYEAATRYPFQNPGDPGLDVSGNGSGCNTSTGRFTVLAAEYGPDDQVLRFDADFEHHCEGGPAALLGSIRFVSNLPTPAPTPTRPTPRSAANLIILHSGRGDYIGGCRSYTYSDVDGRFSNEPDSRGGVRFSFYGDESWQFGFAAPHGERLVPGAYENATAFPFQEPEEPGIRISGEGRGCGNQTGRFVVLEAEYAPDGRVERFAVDFEQECGGVLVGTLRFNSTLPVPTPTPRP